MFSNNEHVVSQPHDELAGSSAKSVKECVQLYMGCRGITKLANFENFVNLEVLWINNNAITKLTGIGNNFRLKALYAQENKITTVVGSSLQNFKFLNELQLFNNEISDLDATLDVISKLRHVEDLGLFGNPVAEEPDYRVKVIAAMPWLRVLDRQRVKDTELEASMVYKQRIMQESKMRDRGLVTGQLNTENVDGPVAIAPSGGAASVATSSKQQVADNTRLKTAEELVGERSACTLLLHKQVAAIKRSRRAAAEEADRKARISLTALEASRELSGAIPLPSLLDFRSQEMDRRQLKPTELSAWESYQLLTLLFKKANEGSTEEELSKAQVKQVLTELELHIAKRLSYMDSTLDALFSKNDDEVKSCETLNYNTVQAFLANQADPSKRRSTNGMSLSGQLSEDEEESKYESITLNYKRTKANWIRLPGDYCIRKAESLFHHIEQLHTKFLLLSSRSHAKADQGESEQNENQLELQNLNQLVKEIENQSVVATKLFAIGTTRLNDFTPSWTNQSPCDLNEEKSQSITHNSNKSKTTGKAFRGDTIRLVSYPDPEPSVIKEFDDEEPGFDSDPDVESIVSATELLEQSDGRRVSVTSLNKRQELVNREQQAIRRFSLDGDAYEEFIQKKRAAQKVAPIWSSFNLTE